MAFFPVGLSTSKDAIRDVLTDLPEQEVGKDQYSFSIKQRKYPLAQFRNRRPIMGGNYWPQKKKENCLGRGNPSFLNKGTGNPLAQKSF
eukprot:1159067-Pelagomonas_calceolata.AAC.5